MQANIMTGTLRLVMHLSWMIMVIMMPVIATTSSSLLPAPAPAPAPSPAPSSVPLHPLQEQMHRGEEQYQVQPDILLEDYGIWNPTPNYGGGYFAPIPH